MMRKRPNVIFSVLTHMDLIVDFSFQKWTEQCRVWVLFLCERSICVFFIHRLFILVAQVMGGCNQIS